MVVGTGGFATGITFCYWGWHVKGSCKDTVLVTAFITRSPSLQRWISWALYPDLLQTCCCPNKKTTTASLSAASSAVISSGSLGLPGCRSLAVDAELGDPRSIHSNSSMVKDWTSQKVAHFCPQGDFKRILHKNYHILEASNPHYQLKTACLYPPPRLSSRPCLVTLIHESQSLSFGLWSCWPKEPARHVCPHGDGSGCIHTVYVCMHTASPKNLET